MEKERTMKIAMVTFPVLDIGGITSWADEFAKGAKRNGHDLESFYAVSGKKYDCSESEYVPIGGKYKRGEKIPSKVLSYHNTELKKTVDFLNTFDVVVFSHPSPHPTKGNLSSKHCINWIFLYSQITKKKIAVFHDRYWAKTNDWFIYVAKHIDFVMADQRPFVEAIVSYPTVASKDWAYFPLTLPETKPLKNRENVAIVATQWIKWKGHYKLLPALQDVENIDIELYAGGQEYHNLYVDGTLKGFLNENLVENEKYENKFNNSTRKYIGYVLRSDLIERYKKALISIDASVRGYNNFTHFEPMLYGCISFVHEDVFKLEACSIPADCCVTYNWSNIKEKIKWVQDNPDEVSAIRKRAFKFIQQFDNAIIAKKVLEFPTSLCTKRTEDELDSDPEYAVRLCDTAYNYLPSIDNRLNEYVYDLLEKTLAKQDKEKFKQWLDWFEEIKVIRANNWEYPEEPKQEEAKEEAVQKEVEPQQQVVNTIVNTSNLLPVTETSASSAEVKVGKPVETIPVTQLTIPTMEFMGFRIELNQFGIVITNSSEMNPDVSIRRDGGKTQIYISNPRS